MMFLVCVLVNQYPETSEALLEVILDKDIGQMLEMCRATATFIISVLNPASHLFSATL